MKQEVHVHVHFSWLIWVHRIKWMTQDCILRIKVLYVPLWILMLLILNQSKSGCFPIWILVQYRSLPDHKPYVMKNLCKAIMKCSSLESKFYKYRTEECREALREQKNYCNKTLYKGKRNYSWLNLINITDKKRFGKRWSLFSVTKGR